MMVREKATTTAWLDHIAGRSDARSEEKEWVDLWRVKVPPKIGTFLWRLARHSISTGDIRHRRSMAPNNLCGICGEVDSWRHSLLDCNMSRCTWDREREDIRNVLAHNKHVDAQGWTTDVMKKPANDEFIRVAVRLGAIWHAHRNRQPVR